LLLCAGELRSSKSLPLEGFEGLPFIDQERSLGVHGKRRKEEEEKKKEKKQRKRLSWWCHSSHGWAPSAWLSRTVAALHVAMPLSLLAMMACHPSDHHIMFCHSTQHGLQRPPWPPCLGPCRAQMVQCWSIGQCSAGAPLRVTRRGYDGLMGRDDFNAVTWRCSINCLLAETRGDSLGPSRAQMMPCLTPRFPTSHRARWRLPWNGRARRD
jgi:hypothetical protein